MEEPLHQTLCHHLPQDNLGRSNQSCLSRGSHLRQPGQKIWTRKKIDIFAVNQPCQQKRYGWIPWLNTRDSLLGLPLMCNLYKSRPDEPNYLKLFLELQITDFWAVSIKMVSFHVFSFYLIFEGENTWWVQLSSPFTSSINQCVKELFNCSFPYSVSTVHSQWGAILHRKFPKSGSGWLQLVLRILRKRA